MPTAAVNEGRRPGRPRKYGQGRINATVRFTPERYAALKAEADRQGRSISEEVERRIDQTFADDRYREIERLMKEMNDLMHLRWQELFNEAMGRIHELEAQIAELEKERALSEDRLAHIVEDAVARALRGGNRPAFLGGYK